VVAAKVSWFRFSQSVLESHDVVLRLLGSDSTADHRRMTRREQRNVGSILETTAESKKGVLKPTRWLGHPTCRRRSARPQKHMPRSFERRI